MLQELLDKQRSYTNHLFDSLDLNEVDRILKILLTCEGTIFLSGVGKSALVAKKIAVTMISTGTHACFLSATDALHGDLGMVRSSDIFIVISKSGESDELLQLIPAIRNKGAHVIGMLCTHNSRLARLCDDLLILPFQKELCPFDLAPTVSTASQLLLGDLLTIAMMQHKQFTLDQYALNHPSGRIGKRITLRVRDLMLTGDKIPQCHQDSKLKQVLVELSNKRCGSILVVDHDHRLLGIFTDGDLRRALQKHGSELLDKPMDLLMTPNPRRIEADLLAIEALRLMEEDTQRRITVLPVVENSRVVGILHIHDLIQSGI